MKVREAIRMIEEGQLVSGRDARQPPAIQASDQAGRVTIASKPSDDLAPGTRNSVMKQAGLKEQR